MSGHPCFVLFDCDDLTIVHRLSQVCEVAEGVDEVLDIGFGLSVDFAAVEGFDLSEFVEAIFDGIGDAVESGGAFCDLH